MEENLKESETINEESLKNIVIIDDHLFEFTQPTTFTEYLCEAYRKKVNGRTEFRLGNGTKVIINPTIHDVTKVYGESKPKTKQKKMII